MIKTVICLALSAAAALAEGLDSATIAKVDAIRIPAGEFVERYSAYLERVSVRDNIVARKDILDNMVNEALIVADVRRRGVDTTASYRESLKRIRAGSLLDAYYCTLADTIQVTEDELRTAFYRANTKIHARHLYAATEEDAWKLRYRFENGESLEQLAREVFTDSKLKRSGGDLGFFSGGEMDPAFEDAAFRLPLGEISAPVKTEDGYSIIKIESRVTKPVISESEYTSKKKDIYRSVLSEKRLMFGKRFAERMAGNLSLIFFEKNLSVIFSSWPTLKDSARSVPNEAADANFRHLLAIRKQPVVTFTRGTWSVQDVLDRIAVAPARWMNRVRTKDDLRELIKGYATREEFAGQARAAGIEQSTYYNEKFCSDSLLMTLREWEKQVTREKIAVDPMSNTFLQRTEREKFDQAVGSEYRNNREGYWFPEEVNVAEIAVDSLKDAAMIFSRIKDGESFSSLAKRHSIRGWAAERGGELGFAPRTAYGIFADTIFALPPGSILGPTKVGETYSIFRILGKKPARRKTFSEAREEIGREVLAVWKRNAFLESVGALHLNAVVNVNTELLTSLPMKLKTED